MTEERHDATVHADSIDSEAIRSAGALVGLTAVLLAVLLLQAGQDSPGPVYVLVPIWGYFVVRTVRTFDDPLGSTVD